MTSHSRDTPQFFLTSPTPCPYLDGQEERKVFTHLVGPRAGELNDVLTHGGFRRSQTIAYRPACEKLPGPASLCVCPWPIFVPSAKYAPHHPQQPGPDRRRTG